MAAALEKAWDGPLEGVVVTRYGYGAPCQRIEVIEAAHPVPDEAGLAASRTLLEQVAGLSADDLVDRADLRRRLGAAAVAAGRADARRRDRRQRGAARLRRADRGDEHDAQARLDDQGRAAGGGCLSGEGRVAGGLRHSRRQSGAGRLGPDHSGCGQPRRCAGDRRGLRHEAAGRRHGASQLAGCRCAARRRSALCRQRGASHRLGRRLARSRRGRSEAAGHRSRDPVGFDRGRGARGRRRACRDRPRGGACATGRSASRC